MSNLAASTARLGAPSLWTPEREASLLELRASGKSAARIAVLLGQGLTRSAVIGKLSRLSAPTPSRPEPSEQPVKTGRSKTGRKSKAEDAGFDREAMIAKAREMRGRGERFSVIGAACGRSIKWARTVAGDVEAPAGLGARSYAARDTARGAGRKARNARAKASPRPAFARPIMPAPEAPKPAQPAREPSPIALPATAVTILDLRVGTCRWPLWSLAETSGHYCGARCSPDGPYCETHRALAVTRYQPGPAREPGGKVHPPGASRIIEEAA